MKRKDLEKHLANDCYLRPYQCEFCGLKDTYEAITGRGYFLIVWELDNYSGHQAKCPEVPLTCPNKCGADKIKRKDMANHRSQCYLEPVECPFAEAGCKKQLKHSQLSAHMASGMQEHLSLIMNDYREVKRELQEHLPLIMNDYQEIKRELVEVKGTLATAIQLLRQGTEADKETVDFIVACSVKLEKINDLVKVSMPKFSEYHHSGKVWHSPPFYYKEGYKMCLAVYANGVGKGAGTHVSVTLILLKGEYGIVTKHQLGRKYCKGRHHLTMFPEGEGWFNVCQYQPLSQYSVAMTKLSQKKKFCTHKYIVSKLANDCLTFSIKYVDNCHLLVSVN